MRVFSLAEIALACAVIDPRSDLMNGKFCIDSRDVQPGDIFVALQGEHVNGHDFLSDVEKSGAVAVIVEKKVESVSMPQWLVTDAAIALGKIAAMYRDALNGPVIGITGSVGKTTVKEMVASILAQSGQPLMTKGNLNNHLGVPLTLLRLTNNHDSAVIEMGASALGEIHYLTQLARPDVALVTAVEPAHVEGFGSIENVAIGKAEIFDGLAEKGTAIINLDNAYTKSWVELLSNQFNTLTYSIDTAIQESSVDFFASNIAFKNGFWHFDLHFRHEIFPVSLAFLGNHNVGNAVAAAACCYAAGASFQDIVSGLEAAKPYKGRLQRKIGFRHSVVIDDSYNANPASVKMAVNVLVMFPAKKKILVLGDMAELGETAQTLHGEVGAYARKMGVTHLMACGELSVNAVKHFGESAQHFANQESLTKACLELADSETVFLVKGSRSAAMDRVVALISNQPDVDVDVDASGTVDKNSMEKKKAC